MPAARTAQNLLAEIGTDMSYHLLREPQTSYADLGADYFAPRDYDPQQQARRLMERLWKLGYNMEIQRPAA